MLGKLWKHEVMAVGKVQGLLYLIMIIYTCFLSVYGIAMDFENRGTELFQDMTNFLSVMLLMGYVIILIAVNVLTFVHLIYRFYQSMVGDEGYLTHTLPVTTGQLLLVKVLSACLFQTISILLSGVSIVVVLSSAGAWNDIYNIFREGMELFYQMGLSAGDFVIPVLLGFAGGILEVACFMLVFYFCIAAGNLFSGHKLLGSVIVYIVHSIVMGILQWIFMIGISIAVKLGEEYLIRLENWFEEALIQNVLSFFNGIMVIAVLIGTAIAALYFAVTRYLLKNKLNLA